MLSTLPHSGPCAGCTSGAAAAAHAQLAPIRASAIYRRAVALEAASFWVRVHVRVLVRENFACVAAGGGQYRAARKHRPSADGSHEGSHPCTIQRVTCNTQHAACNTQRATRSVQHATRSVQQPRSNADGSHNPPITRPCAVLRVSMVRPLADYSEIGRADRRCPTQGGQHQAAPWSCRRVLQPMSAHG